MFILRMPPGEIASIDDIAINVGEIADDRVRVTVHAPQAARVRLMPEDIVVPPRITVWRTVNEQIHIDDDIQVWILRMEGNRVRIGISADEHRRITQERIVTEPSEDF